MESGENQPLLENRNQQSRSLRGASYYTCVSIFLLGCTALIISLAVSYQYSGDIINPNSTTTTKKPATEPSSGESLEFSVFSLMVWGSPGSFGVDDKERRIAAIGDWIANDTDHDIYLLNDLWMRADHETIRKSLPPKGYYISKVEDFTEPNCDGILAPEMCSGLAIISKHPIQNIQWLSFTDHGDLFWDYEYFLRRGAGMVTLEPVPGHTVDVIVTSLASIDYNYWYREHQTADLLKFITHSSADHLIVAGDFNVDSRDNEDTFNTVKEVLKNAMDDSQLTDPKFATLGNKDNTYTTKGQNAVVYDYIWYKNQGVNVKEFKVLNLITPKEEISFSDHQALSAKFELIK